MGLGFLRHRPFSVFSILAVLIVTVSCGESESVSPNNQPPRYSIDQGALDTSVNPCDDFYAYSCGNWIKKTEIPAGYSRWSKSFNVVADENLSVLKGVLEKYAAGDFSLKVASAEKLGHYYSACLAGIQPSAVEKDHLAKSLSEIDALTSKEELMNMLPLWHKQGSGAFFGFYAAQDAKNAERVIAHVDRGGMGLPDREYYLDGSPAKAKLRESYVGHVTRLLTLAGTPEADAAKQATMILALETELARVSLKKEDRRDPNKVYHLLSVDGLKSLSSKLSWDGYFKKVGLPEVRALNVVETEFVKGLDALLNKTELGDLKAYARWHFVHAFAPYLSQPFYDEDFAFYGKTLAGKKAPLPRWKACINATSRALGEALGEAFVKVKFGEAGKAEAKRMIANLRRAVQNNFAEVEWMDEVTRKRASEKLTKIVSKMGFPDKFRDYSALTIDKTSLFDSELNAREFESARVIAKVDKPVNRAEWEMVPHEVNAYYNPNLNEIVFPAGILQSPFFNVKATLANNYGGIGMVIGHEITHGFDDEGRQFDGDGNLSDWWSPQSAKAFEERAACLVKQYDAYTVAEDVHLNGKLTLGENIADLGGLKLSYAAFQSAQRQQGKRSIAGDEASKEFFISFAQGWCSKATPEEEKLRAATDPHAAPKYRVNGVVVNLAQFQKTFGCQTGKPMAPEKRCAIW